MTIAASAFPRLSPSGRRVVAGQSVIVIDRTIEVGPGTGAQWADEETLYYVRQPDGAFMMWRASGAGVVRGAGFNTFSAAGVDHWAGADDLGPGPRVVFSNGAVIGGWSGPALSEDRSVWAALVQQTGAIQTGHGRPSRFADANCRELRWCGRALAWGVLEAGHWQIAGQLDVGGFSAPTLLNVEREEFWPVPLLVDGVMWLLTHSHDRLLLRPWGATQGYVVATGYTSYPDAKALPDGRIRVMWDAGRDVLGERVIDPHSPRVDLRPGVVTPDPDPVDPDPPQERPVRLEPKHSALIDAFAARFPPPGGDEDALRDHWTPRLVEQFVFSFPGEGWCWKSTSPGSRPSSDVIARRDGGGMWGYDVILNAGRPNWALASNAGPIDLRTQAPIPMNPVNHLGATTPVDPDPDPDTPKPPTPTVDLGPVLAAIGALTAEVQALREAQASHEQNEENRYHNLGDQQRLMNDVLARIDARG